MRVPPRLFPAMTIIAAFSFRAGAQSSAQITSIRMPLYSVEVMPGEPPRLAIARDGETVFVVPVVSGLA